MEETLSCRSRSVKKVITAILLCMLLVTSAAPASVSATTNGKTRDDAFNWICARGNEHWTYPYGETWCVSLIVAYYNWLGVGSVSGNAKDYAYNTLPGGWTRVYSNPQPGDIAVWGAGASIGWGNNKSYADYTYGHVGLVVRQNSWGSITTVETRANQGHGAYYYERNPQSAACYIRPDFASSPASNAMNIGQSFNALIIRSDVWKPIYQNLSDGNVLLGAQESGVYARNQWHFERQSDGSYIITSLQDGRALDVSGANSANGTNVGTYMKWGTDNGAQKWYVIGNAIAFELAPKLATDKRLDVTGNSTAAGTNIQIYTANGTKAQTFSIYKFDAKYPTSTTTIVPDQSTYTKNEGTSFQIKQSFSSTYGGGYGDLTWKSSNSSIASVNSNGVVTAKKKGTAYITMTSVYNPLITTTVKVVVNHVHSYTSKVTKAATCTAAGVRTYTCKSGDRTYTKAIPATGHTKELRNVKTATCAHAGYTGDTYCKKCNKKLATGKTVARKAHTWNKGAITTAATCTKKGVKTYTCTVCKGTRKAAIAATGHRNKVLKNARRATCAKAGYTGDTYCKDCNAKLSSGKTIAKKAHTWDAGKVTKKATCTVKGTKTYTCKICKATKTSSIAATGHRHTELRNVKKATCGQEGYTGDTYCKDCKAKVSSGKVIAKTPHKNKIVKFAKESTCKSEGYTGDIFCYDCGSLIEEGTVIDKLEHIWDSGKITVQPTAAKTGVRTYTCENCGATKKTTIPVLNLVGKTVRDKTTNGVYKVLSKTSVEYTKPIAKRAAVNIPAKVKLSGKTFNVTKISANAFRNNTVMKSLTIGSNVTTIGANAFYGCKNLNTVVIKTAKLTSKTVGANAFAKTGAKPVVTVPAKQFNTYKTLLRSKGISTKAVYKK